LDGTPAFKALSQLKMTFGLERRGRRSKRAEREIMRGCVCVCVCV
jgi:hypothetical protein